MDIGGGEQHGPTSLLKYFIQHNAKLSNGVQALAEQSLVLGPPSVAGGCRQSSTSNTLAYEKVPFDSYVYNRVWNRTDNLTKFRGAPSENMFIQSRLSRSPVTNISRVRLAESMVDPSYPQCYAPTPTR